MKTMKKVLCSLLVVVMCLTSAPLSGFVGIEWPKFNIGEWFSNMVNATDEKPTSGQCGDNVYWFFDGSSETLTLSGSGSTWDFGTEEHYIADFMYDYNNKIKNVVVEEGITKLGKGLFCLGAETYGCAVEQVDLPDSLIEIGVCVFTYCVNLEEVNGALNVTKIDYCAFSGCFKLISIELGNIESVGIGAFASCISLEDIDLSNVIDIGEDAFYCCLSLGNINLKNIKNIGEKAFYCCFSLEIITLPASLKFIGANAFNECVYIDEIYVHNTKTEFDEKPMGLRSAKIENIDKEGFIALCLDYFFTAFYYGDTSDKIVDIEKEINNNKYITEYETPQPYGTIICYEGSTAEAYAIETGINYRYFSGETPGGSSGGDPGNGFDYTIYASKPEISGKATDLLYDNDWWKWNTKKFKVSGVINNVLSKYDTWNAAKEYEKKEYYNSLGVNQLKDLYITLKSPDAKKVYFKGGKSEMTFPLGRTIGAGASDTFECDVYVDRDYYPPNGSEVITFECILNGNLDGKRISGVYSTFDVRITNKSYKWEKQSLKELITELKSMVRPYEDYYRSNVGRLYGGTGLFEDMTAVEVAYSAGAMASSLELADTCFDIIYYFTNMNFTLGDVVKEYGKAFMDLLSEDSNDKVSEIIGAMESRLLHNEYFDGFIEWCRANYGVDAGAYAKYSNHCPTDVIVTGEDGRTVLEIINDEILVCDENILANVFESRKTFYLPTGIDYEIKITATDDGTMDYFVETATENGERRIIKYSDVPLVKGKSYTAIAPSYISEDTSVYNLKSEDGTIIKHGCLKHSTIIISSGKAPTCTLSGYVQLLKCTLCGEIIKIGEIAATGHQLEEPLFTEIPATCVSQGVGIFECSKCDYVETKIIPATGHSFTEGQSKCNNCDYDKADDCDCRCHTSGIKAFFFKIKLFFWKLFKKNPLCECGAAHY